MICPYCGTELNDRASFCTECGAKLAAPEVKVPTAPVAPMPVASAAQTPATPAVQTTAAPEGPMRAASAAQTAAPKKTMAPLKRSSIIIAVAAVVLVTAAILFFLSRALSQKTVEEKGYSLYIKDEEIYYTDFSSKGSFKVTGQLFAGDMDLDHVHPDMIIYLCQIPKEGSTIYYPDRFKDDFNSVSLYSRSLIKWEKEPVKIGDEIVSYMVAENNSCLVYLTAEEELYLYDVKKGTSSQVDKGIQSFMLSRDGKTVAYLDDEKVLYLLSFGREKVKIGEAVTEYSLQKDGETVIFNSYFGSKDGNYGVTITSRNLSGEKTKIVDYASYVTYPEDGTFYYFTTSNKEVTLSELIDVDITEDQRYNDFYTWAQKTKVMVVSRTYYYYNGMESIKLTETQSLETGVFPSVQMLDEESKVLLIQYQEPLIDIPLSSFDLDAMTSLSSTYLSSALVRNPQLALYEAGEAIELPEDIQEGSVSGAPGVYYVDGRVYYLKGQEASDEFTAIFGDKDLYEFDPKTAESELKYEDILGIQLLFRGEDIYYIRNFDLETFTGDLYRNEDLIYEGVDVFSLSADSGHVPASGPLRFFTTDYEDKEEGEGMDAWSLWEYTAAKAIHVADEVVMEYTSGGAGILYLTDYNDKRQYGDLYWYYNGTSELMDEEVVWIQRAPYEYRLIDIRFLTAGVQ